MQGKIESGELCTVEPISDFKGLQKGDIFLCKVNGNQYIHLIKAVQGNAFKSETIADELMVGLVQIRFSENA
jgi:hypothetical protein